MAMDGEGISIHSTKEMERYESLCQREFGHTRVYDVNLLERAGMDEGLPLVLQTIGWGKIYRGDQTTRVMDGWLCNRANGNAGLSIDSQTIMIHDLFGHFGINPEA
jgi:hypothetical protein